MPPEPPGLVHYHRQASLALSSLDICVWDLGVQYYAWDLSVRLIFMAIYLSDAYAWIWVLLSFLCLATHPFVHLTARRHVEVHTHTNRPETRTVLCHTCELIKQSWCKDFTSATPESPRRWQVRLTSCIVALKA
jgi:hypothetical protein